MTQSSLVRLEGASFGFGSTDVLSRIDLRVAPGEFAGVMGPNGAGKSTLLRGLLGLLPCRRGRVERNAKSLGYVPQRESLDPVFPLSVIEVVQMGAFGRLNWLQRVSSADRARAHESLERVGLGARGNDQYSALSGGQRQRALIARALVTRPELLLLDEPTSGIDAHAQQVIMELLSELNQSDGVSILFVTHNPKPLEGVVDEVLWVENQRVDRVSLAELLQRQAIPHSVGGG